LQSRCSLPRSAMTLMVLSLATLVAIAVVDFAMVR
jgi:hypothetical protein